MFDIGANLSSSQFKVDVKDVLIRAAQAGVEGIILTSVDAHSLKANLKIIEDYSDIIFLKTTIGLHPHYADSSAEISENLHLVNHKDVIAIGEFGLDYFRMLSPKDIQQAVMHQFMDLAQSHSEKPLFLHEREAFDDFYSILKERNLPNKSVVHCFGGSTTAMKKYLDLGCYIGFTGWISDARRNKDVIEAIKYIPMDRILIETDAPYLTPCNMPKSKRTRRNEPAYLPYVLDSIADIKKLNIDGLNNIVKSNTKLFFNF